MIPALGPLYDRFADLHWPLIRVTLGLTLLAHGWPKLMAGAQAVAAATLARRGIEPALPLAYALILLETVGAVMIVLGLWTRPIAFALVVEFAVIVVQHIPNGFAWTNRGYEFPLLWGLLFLAVALRGGGPWSLDRLLGREV
jgi:putative oxidoreductase